MTATAEATLVHPDQRDEEFWDNVNVIESPSEYGFADDGDSFYDEDLDRTVSIAFAGRGVAPITEHRIPETLYPIQDYVNTAVVDYYLAGGLPETGEGNGGNDCPVLVLIEGRAYVAQGTHRLAAAMSAGLDTFVGRVVTLAPDGWVIPGHVS